MGQTRQTELLEELRQSAVDPHCDSIDAILNETNEAEQASRIRALHSDLMVEPPGNLRRIVESLRDCVVVTPKDRPDLAFEIRPHNTRYAFDILVGSPPSADFLAHLESSVTLVSHAAAMTNLQIEVVADSEEDAKAHIRKIFTDFHFIESRFPKSAG